jgi:hypothetical protein
MAAEIKQDPDLEWLNHVQPVGLVIAQVLLKDLGLRPDRQTQVDSAQVAEHVDEDDSKPTLCNPWAFVRDILGWGEQHVAGSPGGISIPEELHVRLPEHATTLSPTWAVKELGRSGAPWQLLVKIEEAGVDPDGRAAIDGWEATPHQRFERLLRETGVYAGVLITEKRASKKGHDRFFPELRLVYAPKGETSGYLTFPLRELRTVAGRPMLGGLKLLLGSVRLFTDADDSRLPTLLKKSREAQAEVSTRLADQVLGALHELLRGLDAAAPELVRNLARRQAAHLYEGLLTVLMRLVFVLYAEDRGLLPSRSDGHAQKLYESGYSLRALYNKLVEDAALNPDTIDERRGGWGQLLALFRLIHQGHASHFIQARGGKLFDPEQFPFLEGRVDSDDASRVLTVSDGCILRILEGLMTLAVKGGSRERLSYRTLDVEQIGSVYETVMGFTVEVAKTNVLSIKAGKNNKTPVFVTLDALLAKKGKERIKSLKKDAGRALTAAQAKTIEEAKSVEDLAAAFDNMVDERGSPKKRVAPAGTPILQPTEERRRTGSHYTPRSLTGPIVKHALEPAFVRLGPDATPEQVLDLKVCDPAMGSGAFLVEACRAIGERLVSAWARWPEKRPKIPADEDEDLHARRLVAQRCLYGVDKNPRAVDLARLSLWLATLARDHEFTFLDHALKCGDSLVGLTTSQIGAANWDESKPGLPLFRQLVRDKVAKAMQGRAEIQNAPDDTKRAIQEARHRSLEAEVSPIRTMGDAIVSAFFAADKAKAREKARAEIESQISGNPPRWNLLEAAAAKLRSGENGITPFHWEVEFPEVFSRTNGGFDTIIGNPPFLGGTKISGAISSSYVGFLSDRYSNAGDRADLVAYFFRRSFDLLRTRGTFGLIATNTIYQGDTRKASLTFLRNHGAQIFRATRRYKWPGEAAVVVSVVHIGKGTEFSTCWLDGKPVSFISAFLMPGGIDTDPARLSKNRGIAFEGFAPYGAGFLFCEKTQGASPLSEMDAAIANNSKNMEVIFPYVGGDDVLNSPTFQSDRYAIFVAQMEKEEFETEYPDLFRIVEEKVKPERMSKSKRVSSAPWWQFLWTRPKLSARLSTLNRFIVRPKVSNHHAFALIEGRVLPSNATAVICWDQISVFCVLQSRTHEYWARFFASSMKDDMRYTPTDCFENFAFPANFSTSPTLEAAGETYNSFRSQLMIERDEGLTKTYNRFHAQDENAPDIARLRALHHEMDVAVLRAYGWDDLADRAAPEFIEQEADEGKIPKTRFDWPSEFKDDVLARLLALNAQRAAEERAAGLVAADEADDEQFEEDEEEDE